MVLCQTQHAPIERVKMNTKTTHTAIANKERHITIYRSVSGWKAIHYWWNDEESPGSKTRGFWEPWETGSFGFKDKEKAIDDAKAMAQIEGLPYVDPSECEK